MSHSSSNVGQSTSFFRQLLPLVAIVFLGFGAIGVPLAAFSLYVHEVLGFGAAIVGVVVGIESFATICTRRFAGAYCDRHGARPTALLGLPLAALAGLIYGLATVAQQPILSLAILILGRLVMGPAQSLFLTSALTWGIGRVGAARTGMVMAWQGIAIFAALGLGAPLGIALQTLWGFQVIAVCAIVLPLCALIIAWALRPIAAAGAHAHGLDMAATLRLVWRHGLALAFGSVPFAIMSSFLALFYSTQGWSGAGLAFLGFAASYIVVRLFLAHLPDRQGGTTIGMISVAVQLLGQLLLWQAPNSLGALAGAMLTGLGCSLIFPAIGVEAMARVPAHSRGMAIGCFLAFLDICSGLTGPLVGMVIGGFGYRAAFLTGAIACLLSLLLMHNAAARPGERVRNEQEATS